ncbi:unnamed protein product [Caenorhabditis auriculariae]|uniref:G-protein coupled receptors family 3 profile domain-containing protein n=1 Tax=Caenorhabditis auriculariae TaxID=2777116 RepID=A0A8S1GNL1_9PELO|nr:unnamed protein product [Caenorhabditis auriculariae]
MLASPPARATKLTRRFSTDYQGDGREATPTNICLLREKEAPRGSGTKAVRFCRKTPQIPRCPGTSPKKERREEEDEREEKSGGWEEEEERGERRERNAAARRPDVAAARSMVCGADVRRLPPSSSNRRQYRRWQYYRQYVLSSLLLLLLAAATSSVGAAAAAAVLQQDPTPLSELLSSLDQGHPCGHVVEAEAFLATAVALKFPRLIQLSHFFANHSKNFDVSLIDKSSFSRQPPFNLDLSRKTHFYGLQLDCTAPTSRWLPRLVFPSQDPNATYRQAYLTLNLDQFEVDLCSAVPCDTKCSWTVHGGLRVLAKACCAEINSTLLCRTDAERGRHMLLAFNSLCAFICLVLIPVVCYQRKRQHEVRGWALMELFLIGASILYSILFLDWVAPPEAGCCVAVWLRQIGFSIFYGSIVLKKFIGICKNIVSEKRNTSMLALTVTGLMAWTVGSWGDGALWRTAWPQCHMQGWHFIWHGYEMLFLLYAIRLCYKARNSDWLERWQFTVAVCLEAVITLMANLIRYSIRNSGRSDTLFIVSFVHLQLTVSVNIVIIVAPKFYLSNGEPNRRSMTLGGHSGRAHPSLAKLRDNILNGTIDFAEVPIIDMNPEDIRAELKRVYTQLRMYKLKNLYQDNPHISKKRGGKKWSDKNTRTRRISIPTCSPQAKRIEEDEKSDLTVESAPHNVYLSTYKLQIEPNHSVRV